MTDTTLSSLTAQLGSASRSLDAAQRALDEAEIRAVECKARSDEAEAKAYLEAEGTVDERKRLAILACGDLLKETAIADAGLRSARSLIKVLQTKIDVGRTLISSARAEMQNFGGAT